MFRRHAVLAAILVLAAVATSGCQYLEDRGRDALDVFDVGVTVTPDPAPEFALFADFFTILPVGYTNLDDTKMFGICNRQVGLLDLEHKSWGYILDGSYKAGGGTFNPADPHQSTVDYDLCERPQFDIGWAPRETETPPTHFIECDRVLHLGWVGVRLVCRPVDLLDFVLGFTTIDIMGDDGLENPCLASGCENASKPACESETECDSEEKCASKPTCEMESKTYTEETCASMPASAPADSNSM